LSREAAEPLALELLLVAPELELLELVPLADLPPEELLLVAPELELLELVPLSVTVAEAGDPRLAAPATATRLTANCLLAPAALTGTAIVREEVSPSAQLSVPLVGT
jgi:hypothetical protein